MHISHIRPVMNAPVLYAALAPGLTVIHCHTVGRHRQAPHARALVLSLCFSLSVSQPRDIWTVSDYNTHCHSRLHFCSVLIFHFVVVFFFPFRNLSPKYDWTTENPARHGHWQIWSIPADLRPSWCGAAQTNGRSNCRLFAADQNTGHQCQPIAAQSYLFDDGWQAILSQHVDCTEIYAFSTYGIHRLWHSVWSTVTKCKCIQNILLVWNVSGRRVIDDDLLCTLCEHVLRANKW